VRVTNELNTSQQELVALGAAIASNCVPCIEYHIPEARKAGLSDTQIREAVKIADKVRRVPARSVMRTALARLEETRMKLAETPGSVCACSASSRSASSGGTSSS
jgi:4-carboxymuconolactone decarboxylase